MSRDPDRELRNRFGILRDVDRATAPAYGAIRSRTQAARTPPARHRRPLIVAVLAAAAVLLLVTLIRPSHRGPALGPSLAHPASWRGPTDFLLEVPGRELWRTVPTFGWSVPWRDPYPTLRPRSESI